MEPEVDEGWDRGRSITTRSRSLQSNSSAQSPVCYSANRKSKPKATKAKRDELRRQSSYTPLYEDTDDTENEQPTGADGKRKLTSL